MSMFGKFKAAKEKIYDPKDDTIKRTKGDKNGYINHKCDLLVSVQAVKNGKIDNRGCKIDKHHFLVVEMKIEKVHWQSETMPITKDKLEQGVQPASAPKLVEGECKDYWITLPRFFHDDPKEYTTKELHQIADACDLIGGIVGVEAEAVDLEEVDDLTVNDGTPLKGRLFGVSYKEVFYDATDDKPERVFINASPYPVDQETGERITPATAEEVAAMSAAE